MDNDKKYDMRWSVFILTIFATVFVMIMIPLMDYYQPETVESSASTSDITDKPHGFSSGSNLFNGWERERVYLFEVFILILTAFIGSLIVLYRIKKKNES